MTTIVFRRPQLQSATRVVPSTVRMRSPEEARDLRFREFCSMVHSPGVKRYVAAHTPRSDDPYDVASDFLVEMATNGKWLRFDPQRGNLESFVIRYMFLFILRRRKKATNRACATFDPNRDGSCSPRILRWFTSESAKTVLFKIQSRVRPEQAELMEAVVGSGGDVELAARRLGWSTRRFSGVLTKLRREVRRQGLCIRAV